MRILYIDIDSLRPDHLGCYGYPRATSPNLDRLAAEGVRLTNCYASDAPCLPSRTSLFRGQFGIRHGAVNHSGTRAEPFGEGPARRFRSGRNDACWMGRLRQAGMYTATVSPFAERHSAWHWCAGFREIHNPGRCGRETAEDVVPIALDWLARRAAGDDWFLHVNLWDAHVPYRVPAEAGEPFAGDPLPDWLTDEVLAEHLSRPGIRSAHDTMHYRHRGHAYPRAPHAVDSPAEVRRMFDGYDTAIRHIDHHVGRLLEALEAAGVLDETIVAVGADHGECLGELNGYAAHHVADQCVCRIPMILRGCGLPAGFVDASKHYHIDVAATLVELAGGTVGDDWDGAGFAAALRGRREGGREFLVLSQLAQTAQRAVRFADGGGEYIAIRTWIDGYHAYPQWMVFDVEADPHEQHDLTAERPELIDRADALLDRWRTDALARSDHPDPLETVLAEKPEMHRGAWPAYADRLRQTHRAPWVERLTQRSRDYGDV